MTVPELGSIPPPTTPPAAGGAPPPGTDAISPQALSDIFVPVGASTATPAGGLSVRNLWKVFGPGAESVPGNRSYDGLSRAELREATGATAAIRDVSFDVAPGEVFIVMGLSGSGKSTLIRCVTRLIEPTAGVVTFGDCEVSSAGEAELRDLRRKQISMVFQHFGLLPNRSVLDNVAFGLEVGGSSKESRYARAEEVIALVGLAGYESSYPDQLSGGMRQRVGLARALAGDPRMLLFDEPFSALDPMIRRDMQKEVIRLHHDMGKTMVFVTHDLPEALILGDRILLMRDGAIAQMGTGEELVGAPADDYVADFVRDIPRAAVLTLGWIARPPAAGKLTGGPVLASSTVIAEAAAAALSSDAPLQVERGGAIIGVVSREDILTVMASTSYAGA